MSMNRCSDVQNGYKKILERSLNIWFVPGSIGNLKIITILAGLMIALTSLFHANSNKTNNNIQSDYQHDEDQNETTKRSRLKQVMSTYMCP